MWKIESKDPTPLRKAGISEDMTRASRAEKLIKYLQKASELKISEFFSSKRLTLFQTTIL